MTPKKSHPHEPEATLLAPRSDHIARMALAYTKFLNALDWQDSLLIGGLREARTKALSTIYMELMKPAPKHHQTHYITEGALSILRCGRGEADSLRWEHIVPCTEYIRTPCEDAAQANTLTIELVADLLDRYWWLATILRAEDRKLSRLRMPANWDGNDVLARYRDVGIDLMPNPLFGSTRSRT